MNLLKVRKSLGLSQAELGQLMGINQPVNYARLEAGRRKPTKQQIQAIKNIMYIADMGALHPLLRATQPHPGVITRGADLTAPEKIGEKPC